MTERKYNGANEIAAVISVSDQSSLHHTANDWAALVHQDVLRVCPNVGEPIAQQVITEKRATIASSVNRSLPDMHDLNARGIWLAGDWLHSRYPATLEAAVLSGQAAAQSVLRYEWFKFRLGQGDNDRRVRVVHKGSWQRVLI